MPVGSGKEEEQSRKLLIGGISYKTTNEALRSYFVKYGEVCDSVVIKAKKVNISKGFGFVIYQTEEEADDCMNERPHFLDERQIDVKRAFSKEESLKPRAFIELIKINLTPYWNYVPNLLMDCDQLIRLLNVYYQKELSPVFDIFYASYCIWQINPPKNYPFFLGKEEIKVYLERNSDKRSQPQFSLIAYRDDFEKGIAVDLVGLRETEFGLTAFHDYLYIEKHKSQLKVVTMRSTYTKRIADLKVDHLKEHIMFENEVEEETTVEDDEGNLLVGNLPDDCKKDELEE